MRKKIFLLVIAVAYLFTIESHGQGTYLWNGQRLKIVKEHPALYQHLILKSKELADKHLDAPNVVVTDKPDDISLDPHYYASLSIYFWPDPKNPKGKYIIKDGQKNPEYKKYDGGKIEDLMLRLKHLSLAYYFTEDEKYRDAYLSQLNAWFIDKRTYMYPSFDYSQFAPGHNNGKGMAGGLIDAYWFNDIIESIRLVDSVEPIDKKTMKKLKRWFSDFSDWLTDSENGQYISEKATNNQAIAYDALLVNMKLFSKDVIWYPVVNTFGTKRLQKQISKDGKQPEELKRTNAMTYSIYNLTHIIDLCRILQIAGVDIYAENKELIEDAFDYLLQFVGNKQAFPYTEGYSWKERENMLICEYNRLPAYSRTRNIPFDFFSSLDNLLK